jgi:Rrf2 family protein
MFQLSKAGEYAVTSLLYMARRNSKKTCLVQEIAEAENIPLDYLAKVLQRLVKYGFVQSRRGATGGFKLARDPFTITLAEVVEKVEGPIFFNYCLACQGACPKDATCPVYPVWKEAQEKMLDVLRRHTIGDLAAYPKSASAAPAPTS